MRPTRPTADVLRLAGLLRAEGFTVAETAALCGLDPADVPDPPPDSQSPPDGGCATGGRDG